MADVLLLSSAPANDPHRPHPYDELNRMREAAAADKFGRHKLTSNPEQADVILFVENCDTITHYLEVRKHPYRQAYREKCFLFSYYDHPIPFLPGVYASIAQRWHVRQRTRSGHYLKAFTRERVEYEPEPVEQLYLYSFMGAAANHPVRQRILDLAHDAQYLRDTSQLWPYGELKDATRAEFEQHYVDICRASKFILCPRGVGASSIRLFESLRMGRAPVIISDQWVPPEGPDWETFSVRIAEKEVEQIPQILTAYADEAEEMGHRARAAWENWFSKEATFHRVVEWCLDIKRSRRLPEPVLQFAVAPQLLHPLHLKALLKKVLSPTVKHHLQKAAVAKG